MIVVDTNVIAYCWIGGERTPIAQRVRLRDPEWHVPVLWRSELRSALVGYLRQGAMDAGQAAATMVETERALASFEHVVASATVLELAARTRLSAYDCEFVALAQSLAVPLVTEDAAILKAFPQVALTMEAYLAAFPSVQTSAHQATRSYYVLRPLPKRGDARATRGRP